jgi:predicted Zn-dependent protease with MMP-like domain
LAFGFRLLAFCVQYLSGIPRSAFSSLLWDCNNAHKTVPMTFPELARVAEQVVPAAQRRLPAAVREPATAVPVCYEPRPNDGILAEGWEPDILGLFVGHEHGGELVGDFQNLPPQILLFLENIWEFAEGEEAVYRDEVRLTYLHELGHYLGWDEDEVARRGLE